MPNLSNPFGDSPLKSLIRGNALPRIKDFRGLSPKGFDKFGNYTFGVKEHIIFPEVSFDRADKVRGLDIVVVIKALNKNHAFALLEKMNFPFIKKGDN